MEERLESLTALSDEELGGLAASGRAAAEELLVLRYTRLVRARAHSLYLVGGDSEDLIQEGMIGLLHAIRSYDSAKAASFRTFAETCVRNRLYSVLRSANSERQAALNQSVSFDTPFFDGNSYAPDVPRYASSNPEDLVIDEERFSALFAGIQKQLSAFEGKVLGYYLQGYSCREIAGLTGRSPKSVDNAVQRLRRKIERHLFPGEISGS
ncbi:MAG: sigma-70 family RNA polymerase sigma factor [Oscillospiraceae bacterium]